MRIVTDDQGRDWVLQRCAYCDTYIKYPQDAKNVGCPTCHAVYNRSSNTATPEPDPPSSDTGRP